MLIRFPKGFGETSRIRLRNISISLLHEELTLPKLNLQTQWRQQKTRCSLEGATFICHPCRHRARRQNRSSISGKMNIILQVKKSPTGKKRGIKSSFCAEMMSSSFCRHLMEWGRASWKCDRADCRR
ncbi:hypothetical protein CDAR_79351 [Caerostris darwini]|uniref:Uncharacterized protein n=1 Tax=Caerostris darwini TaxID=1538125 RepID=A0AAV4RLG0_9ARAC|nr:hypothetical protein CDAR_79351 [Caerostris darwini]